MKALIPSTASIGWAVNAKKTMTNSGRIYFTNWITVAVSNKFIYNNSLILSRFIGYILYDK